MAPSKKYVVYLCALSVCAIICYHLVYSLIHTASIFDISRYRLGRDSRIPILSAIKSYIGQLLPKTKPVYTDWYSIDQRPLPAWYDDAKLGIFIHWGVFSVPSFSVDKKLLSEWFWWNWKGNPRKEIVEFMQKNYSPEFTYADFAEFFTAEFFNPDEWTDMIASSGARYVVLTSKHHEGFTNWPSKYSFNWNSNATGPSRDLVGELANSIRSNTNIKFGLYHSMFEWFHPLYLSDKANGFKTNDFVKGKTLPELYEIVNKYKPEVVWSDGDGEAPDTYWTSKEFLAWLYTDSPVKDTVVVNDRWGKNITCHHGGFFTCTDRYNPGVLQKHKWENAMTIDHYSWGYRRNAHLKDYLSIEQILETFVTTVSCGGNMLMNVGPTKDGRISPIFEERLRQMGFWLKINGEGIYGSKPWTYQNDTVTKTVWYTKKKTDNGTAVYAFLLAWPESGDSVTLGAPVATSATNVTMMGYDGNLSWSKKPGGGIVIELAKIPWNKLPCLWAWGFKLEGLSN